MNIQDIRALFTGAAIEKAHLSSLVLLDELQQRHKVDKEAIDNYTATMKAEGIDDWEPVKVVELTAPHTLPDGSELEIGAKVLVDGFQRVEAATQANYAVFRAMVTRGTFEEAMYYTMTANTLHGVRMTNKDLQKAIKTLYALNPEWREHGRKKDMAAMFRCSEKTVQRAVKAIDDEIKAQAFAMFSRGSSNKEVQDFSQKSASTVKRWREEWEESQATNDGPGGSDDGSNDEPGEESDTDFLNMTLKDMLEITDKGIQHVLLGILFDAYGIAEEIKKDKESKAEPEPDNKSDIPFDVDVETDADGAMDKMEILAKEWKAKTAYELLGVTANQIEGWSNKKAQLKRYENKLLKQCHPDKFGKDNPALTILMHAVATVRKTHNITG